MTIRRVVRRFGWAAILAGSGVAGHANDQDFSQNLPLVPSSAESVAARRADEVAVAGIFETRWVAAASEYFRSDGTQRRSHATGSLFQDVKHLGIVDSVANDIAPIPDYIDTDRHGDSEAESSKLSRQSLPDEPEPRCGPSRIDPARIKILVEDAAVRNGVDPGFAIAIVAVESDFDRDRNSPTGARGPMQLMPATAKRFNVDDVCDPVGNIEGGIRYLRTLLDEFGNPLLAAAAYNAGEQRIYEYGGMPPFAETVGYVAKVVNYQLGLPAPSARRIAAGSPSANGTREVGVIAPRKTGSFVAGVMHF